MVAFRSFLGCQLIIYAKLVAICEGLELATQLGYFALEVESDSTTVVYWIHSQGPIRWDYVYLLRRMCALISSSHILIRHVLWGATSIADFLANWAYSHRLSQHFFCTHDLPTSLSGISHLNAQTIPHVRR